MRLGLSLLLYFIVLVIILSGLSYYRFNYFSAFFLAVFISTLFLLVIHPYNSDDLQDINSETLLYYTLIIIYIFVLFTYSMTMAIHDIKK